MSCPLFILLTHSYPLTLTTHTTLILLLFNIHQHLQAYVRFWEDGKKTGLWNKFTPPPFGDFYDKDGWHGVLATTRLLRLLFCHDGAERHADLDKRMSMIPLTSILKADASRKIAKRVTLGEMKQLRGIYTVMNK